MSHDEDDIKYECDFVVPKDFGEIGAILVENEHHQEMYLNNITLDGLQDGTLIVNCNSWIASKSDNPEKRVFFTDKVSTTELSNKYINTNNCVHNICQYTRIFNLR